MSELKKITPQMIALIEVIMAQPEARFYGFDVYRTAGLLSGTGYAILFRMERAGWLASTWEDPHADLEQVHRGPLRRYYQVTTDGQQAMRAVLEARKEPRKFICANCKKETIV